MMQLMENKAFKAPAKLYRIGEIVQHTPFTRQTIHNYTIMGLIQETDWTSGGHRLYDESVFERLWRIQELRKTKTLSEIKELFEKEYGASEARPSADQNWSAVSNDV